MQRKFVLRGKLFVPHWWDKEGFTCLNMSVGNLIFEVFSLLLWARRRAPHARAAAGQFVFVARARCCGATFLGKVVTDVPVL